MIVKTTIIDNGSKFAIQSTTNRGVRVPLADFDGWECRWSRFYTADGRRTSSLGVHTWTKPNAEPLALASNAAWAPGEPFPQAVRIQDWLEFGGYAELGANPSGGDVWPVRMHVASRRLPPKTLPRSQEIGLFTLYGAWWDAGEQGGDGIEIHPQYDESTTLYVADQTAQRNPIAAFHSVTGMPLTRRELGRNEYRLDRAPLGELVFDDSPRASQQHWQFRAAWDRSLGELGAITPVDGYHLIRAFGPDYALVQNTKDPVARWRILMLAQDAMNAWTLDPAVPGDKNLARVLANVRANPGKANVGVIREWAWVIRCVACALELAPGWREARAWLEYALDVFALVQAQSGAFADHHAQDNLDQNEPITLGTAKQNEGWMPAWHVPFLLRALYHACESLGCDMNSRCGWAVVSWWRVMEALGNTPDEYAAEQGVRGLARYLLTSRNGALLSRMESAWNTSRAEGEPDVAALAARLGIIDRIPTKYLRGESRFSQDAFAFAFEAERARMGQP